MYTVYTNGNFISLNDDSTIYSIMVVGGKKSPMSAITLPSAMTMQRLLI